MVLRAWKGQPELSRRCDSGGDLQRVGIFEVAGDTARAVPPHPAAPESEQGILKTMLPDWSGAVGLDYTCAIIQNVGFVAAPIFTFE